MVLDRTRMEGSRADLLINRSHVTVQTLDLAGSDEEGGFTLRLTFLPNQGSGIRLTGPLTVTGGPHTVLRENEAANTNTIELGTAGDWNIGENAELHWSIPLTGSGGITKRGTGILRMGGNHLHTGDTIIESGGFGPAHRNLHLAGSLRLGAKASLLFDDTHTISTDGSVTFEDSFGVADLAGLDSSTDPGTHALISGSVDFGNIQNVGSSEAFDLGGGKSAYFENNGGLHLIVTVEPAEPPSFAPSIRRFYFDTGEVRLEFEGPVGATYKIQKSNDLIDWHDLDVLIAPEIPFLWTASEGREAPKRFYRILVEP